MAGIPINIEKIKTNNVHSEIDTTEYLITFFEKGQNWDKSIRCSISDLKKFKDHIDQIIMETSTSETLNISEEKGMKLDNLFATDLLCKNCKYKLSHHCITCVFELQSPLERKLFLALKKKYIKFDTQYALDWQGYNISIMDKSYNHPTNNFKDVLTVVDFYIEKKNVKLCIYTDGHTYHERTEEQAQRDRKIDRKLQELGFKVLRYTGKDVNDDIEKIITDIKKWIK